MKMKNKLKGENFDWHYRFDSYDNPKKRIKCFYCNRQCNDLSYHLKTHKLTLKKHKTSLTAKQRETYKIYHSQNLTESIIAHYYFRKAEESKIGDLGSIGVKIGETEDGLKMELRTGENLEIIDEKGKKTQYQVYSQLSKRTVVLFQKAMVLFAKGREWFWLGKCFGELSIGDMAVKYYKKSLKEYEEKEQPKEYIDREILKFENQTQYKINQLDVAIKSWERLLKYGKELKVDKKGKRIMMEFTKDEREFWIFKIGEAQEEKAKLTGEFPDLSEEYLRIKKEHEERMKAFSNMIDDEEN